MIQETDILRIDRLKEHQNDYPEIKDPNVILLPDNKYMMYASVGRSTDQQWMVGRFIASDLKGPWQEVRPAKIVGISGPQMCAPAVIYEKKGEKEQWTMYIQTACFIEGGVIAEAVSYDGETFTEVNRALITKEHIEGEEAIIGVYDPGISEVRIEEEEGLALVFSGYRRIGSGDLYLSYKKKTNLAWGPGKLILKQEDVPFHNKPGTEFFEWGLEGGKLIQVSKDCFLLIAVCFLPLPEGFGGQRQRVFFAAAPSFYGPYIPLGIAFQPQERETGSGEHGHPDTVIDGDDLWIIYQERDGEGAPWYLRYVRINYPEFVQDAKQTLLMHPLR